MANEQLETNQNLPENNLPKRTVYDSVFCCMARDKKYLIQIFKALHPEDTISTSDDLKIINLQTALVDDIYNDLSFEANDRTIILVEAQSTWSDNVILRIMLYYLQELKKRLKDENLYRQKAVKLLEPEFYLVFTGKKAEIPETISFADIFFAGKKASIDVSAKVIHLPGTGDIIAEYITFCKIYHEEYELTGRTPETLENTLKRCKSAGVLVDFLNEHEHEVKAMYEPLYDDDTIFRNYVNDKVAEARIESRNEGHREGRKEGRDEVFVEMLKKGNTIETIMQLVDVSRDKLESLLQKINSQSQSAV